MEESRNGHLVILIVDDEQPARENLRVLVEDRSEVHRVFEAANAHAARELMRRHSPDIMFLDIQMPDQSGLDVLHDVDSADLPLVIFVTGYRDHAVDAFGLEAVDYLLKPFSDQRFEAAWQRALWRLRSEKEVDLVHRMRSLLSDAEQVRVGVAEPGDASMGQQQIALKSGGRTELVQLDPKNFVRVHRSAIVNLGKVIRIERDDAGRHHVVMQDGKRVRVSRSGKQQLDKRFGNGPAA
jgi:two-component system LytT family response regulator